MGRFTDSIITFRILRLLTTPFAETEAYRLGIIDDKGRELKKMSRLNTVAERDAYTVLHRLVFRLKRIIEKVPIENKKLLSYAAALALIKEHANDDRDPVNLEEMYLDKIKTQLDEEMDVVEKYLNEGYTLTFRQFVEEEGAPANNAAATPGIDGLTGDPPVSKKKQKKYKQLNTMFRR